MQWWGLKLELRACLDMHSSTWVGAWALDPLVLLIAHLAVSLETLPLGSEALLCVPEVAINYTQNTVPGSGLKAKAVSCLVVSLILNMVHHKLPLWFSKNAETVNLVCTLLILAFAAGLTGEPLLFWHLWAHGILRCNLILSLRLACTRVLALVTYCLWWGNLTHCLICPNIFILLRMLSKSAHVHSW